MAGRPLLREEQSLASACSSFRPSKNWGVGRTMEPGGSGARGWHTRPASPEQTLIIHDDSIEAMSEETDGRCLGMIGGLGGGSTVHYYQEIVKAHGAPGTQAPIP